MLDMHVPASVCIVDVDYNYGMATVRQVHEKRGGVVSSSAVRSYSSQPAESTSDSRAQSAHTRLNHLSRLTMD
jgi:hypothetical protein